MARDKDLPSGTQDGRRAKYEAPAANAFFGKSAGGRIKERVNKLPFFFSKKGLIERSAVASPGRLIFLENGRDVFQERGGEG